MKDYFARFLHFKPQLKIFLILPLFFLLNGCVQYKVRTEHFLVQPAPDSSLPNEVVRFKNERNASTHWLYKIVPRHRSQIQWYDLPHWMTWMLFGNDDDGLFGESFKNPYEPFFKNDIRKALKWWLRNPLHNFCFYAIGSAQRENSEFVLFNVNSHGISGFEYESKGGRNFGCACSSLFFAFHGGKPFISARLRYPWNRQAEFYIGWRERGNFGIKFLPMMNEKTHSRCFLDMDSKEINADEGVFHEY